MKVVSLSGAMVLLERFPALAGVDFEVESGEVVLVRGANGAGKTTLLHLCAGLLRLTQGHGDVLGCDLATERAAVRRRVGLLGHDTALYGELTAVENLRLWARASRVGAADVAGVLESLELPAGRRDIPIAKLSAGQRRRVGLATIVLRRPELWLLDEPHAGLDSSGRRIVDGIITAAAGAGAAVVLASHERRLSDDLAHRSVTLAGGCFAADAPDVADPAATADPADPAAPTDVAGEPKL
ncbi:MAG: heme ABC exporter ATP-binding protein CcmA [Acidimicrobiaceae bacterium]|nr:heme ABC exporter ATP-binding protein CcmA [Acidimicrobiaceae bacterium]MCY4280836.1 heme ABC exporter ATP-binding protein CcmA [Acidimicrobiaceae bacterium]MCY4293291.1 heme ABC exporter ATP-binding protein CcmA [Acidimicrobiaceae bacterium]